MNTRYLLLLAVMPMAAVATAQMLPAHHIGIVHHEIAESSPIAAATISVVQDPDKRRAKVKARLVIENQSDHEIAFESSGYAVWDIRDAQGALPPETDIGCTLHFFSQCYKYEPLQEAPPLVIPVHKKVELRGYLTDYDLTRPGTYTAVAYIHLPNEVPEYFKSNKITFTIQ